MAKSKNLSQQVQVLDKAVDLAEKSQQKMKKYFYLKNLFNNINSNL